jgi:hypothetical protein
MNPEDDPMLEEIAKIEAATVDDVIVIDGSSGVPTVQVMTREEMRLMRLQHSANIIANVFGSVNGIARKYEAPPEKAIAEVADKPSGCRGKRSGRKFSKRIEEKFLAARRKKLGLYP